MPLIQSSTYKPSRIFRTGHINTIYPALFRKIPSFDFERERIDTLDGDFLDLDWAKKGNDRLLIALHGLEGSAERPYIQGVIQYFNRNGWDGVGLNLRSCSGELNRKLQSYNMGSSDDLAFVIDYIIEHYDYKEVVLVGFSMGGNIILKYLGEGNVIPSKIKAAVAFSVPCHIPTATIEIERWQNWQYVRRFMKTLNEKTEKKAKMFPSDLDVSKPMPRNFTEFDGRFTAPVHGYSSAADYWTKCSSLQFLENISIPTLLVNAKDDSFLSTQCFPYEIAKSSIYFHLETPKWGGHVGFVGDDYEKGVYWSERRALEFISASC